MADGDASSQVNHRWLAMIATSEVVVLVTSQQWIWDECATHQRAAMCGHALKWHDERDSCRLARMADGAARVGGVGRLWTALCGWIGSSGAASTTSNRRRSDSGRRRRQGRRRRRRGRRVRGQQFRRRSEVVVVVVHSLSRRPRAARKTPKQPNRRPRCPPLESKITS